MNRASPERVVDFHTHLGYSSNYGNSPITRSVAVLRAAGFSGAVILPFERGAAVDYRAANDRVLAAARRYPELCPFGRLDTSDLGASLDELARVKAGGARGIKLHPVSDGVDPADPVTGRLLDAIVEAELPVLVHTNRGDRCRPSDWALVIRERPNMTFIMGHGGYFDWRGAVALACSEAQVYVEPSLCPALICERVAQLCPPDRILFGSDHPYGDNRATYDTLLRAIRRSCAPEEVAAVTAAAFYGNAERLLGRTFEALAPLGDLDNVGDPRLSLAATVKASDEEELAALVFQMAHTNCTFRLSEPAELFPGEEGELRIQVDDAWHAVRIRVMFGHGLVYSAKVLDPGPEAAAAIARTHERFHTALEKPSS